MVRHSDISDPLTRSIIDDLFTHPPVNDAELRKRLESVNEALARRLAVDKLHEGDVPDRAGPVFLAVIGALGVGHQKKRLLGIASDTERPSGERLFAAMAVTSENPETMDALVGELGPEGMGMLAELSLFELLATQDASATGESIAMALDSLLGNRPIDVVLERIEMYRQARCMTCEAAYKESLERESLSSIRKNILDVIVEDATDDGVQLLTALRDTAVNEGARRDFQAALLRLGSRRIDPNRIRRPQTGKAFISNCDGLGDFVLLGCFENPDDTLTMADLCIRAGGEVRDGTVYIRRSPKEVDSIKTRISDQLGCYFVEIPLELAASMVLSVAHDDQLADLEQETREVISVFERAAVAPESDAASDPSRIIEPELTEEAVTGLLSRPEYEDTWYFDYGDLDGLDAKAMLAEKDDRWMDRALTDLVGLRDRLIAMCDHMSLWHRWNGETEVAALCDAAADSVSADIATSPLARVILKRSAHAAEDMNRDVSCFFGDASTRLQIKMRFFKEIISPTGRDLARLDMVEATATALTAAFERMPMDRRPSEADLLTAAFELGKTFADHLVSDEEMVPDYTVPRMSESLADTCGLTDSERHSVIMTVVPSLYSFVEEVCSICPVDCLKRPSDDVADVFFMPHHPLTRGLFERGGGDK